MPPNGHRPLASPGDCSPAALASPYSETAWKKLYPINGHISSSIVHSARPLSISHSSLTSSGLRGASQTRNVSGEGKEDILQISVGEPGSRPEIIQCSCATNTAIGEENKAVANTFGIHQLVD